MSVEPSSILIIAVILSMAVNVAIGVPKCLIGSDASSCASVAEWKENILCRIQGPGEGNARTGGYMDDAIPKTDDNYITVKMKLRAQSVYSSLTVILNSDWQYQNSFAAIATLASFEKAVNRVGIGLYGVNWVIATKPCGVNGKAYTLCGDKGNQLQPSGCS